MKRKMSLPADYPTVIAQLKQRVREAQLKAARTVNRELIALYWDIGNAILRAQQHEGWGTKVVSRLADDMRRAFPEMSGFSRANLLYMRAFANAWVDDTIVQQPVGLLPSAKKSKSAIVQQPVGLLPHTSASQSFGVPPEPIASLPWGHNVVLVTKLDSPEERRWHAAKAVEYGWSRAMLTLQIETKLRRRHSGAITNFAATLPASQSELAAQTLKDPYIFDFLTLDAAARERDLERGLMDNIEQFLVELGVGFAFVGASMRWKLPGRTMRSICSFIICDCGASSWWTLKWKRSSPNLQAR